MDDILGEFLTETTENLSQLDQDLVTLEKRPNNPELISSIFRTIHTIKGTCGFIDLTRLEKVAHSGENLLGKIRDGAIEATPEAITLILQTMDRIRSILTSLEAGDGEGDPTPDKELIARLDEFTETGGLVASQETPPSAPPQEETPLEALPEAEHPLEGSNPEDVIHEAAPAPMEKQKEVSPPKPQDSGNDSSQESQIANQSIRVSVGLLENLMTAVSELVLTRNQLLQMAQKFKGTDFEVPLQRLNHVTSELQEGVMKTRMQPIGNAWSKMPRMVRDLAHELGKKIQLEMTGAETELDRQVLELIKDPLTHLVRNSADHGLETPQERAANGKSETGTIKLHAYHEGGHIVMSISDDGRGLNTQKIKEKALSSGLATETQLESMSDNQINQFIFKAGFSTADKVSHVSGRGVGMDVVNSNIEKIGGNIELKSKAGEGSSVIIKIPLTLAIISALIVGVGEEQYAIPQIGVIELVRVTAQSDYVVEYIHGAPFLRLRNRLLSLIPLGHHLGLNESNEIPEETFVVVIQVGSAVCGILVDQVFETQEIVVKPVSPILRHVNVFSGNTILGDGSVVMILDLNGVSTLSGEIGEDEGDAPSDHHEDLAGIEGAKNGETMTLLLFQAGPGAPKAVPLGLIARLEEIDVSKIESPDGQMAVQYRDQLMPLMVINPMHEMASQWQPVLVFNDGRRSIGVMVDSIVDITEHPVEIKMKTIHPGSFGSAIIHGTATDLLDIDHYIKGIYPDWSRGDGAFYRHKNADVLLIDDSTSFINLLSPVLKLNGYRVTSVTSARGALELLDKGISFDSIISDIDMPSMNGFEFAKQIRTQQKYKDIPLIAFSSTYTPDNINQGHSVGFNAYIAKSDRDGLIEALDHVLHKEM